MRKVTITQPVLHLVGPQKSTVEIRVQAGLLATLVDIKHTNLWGKIKEEKYKLRKGESLNLSHIYDVQFGEK